MFNKSNKPFCPLIRKDCIEGLCKFWTRIQGTNPQTGNPIDSHDCAVSWLPVLLIENAKETRQGAAATESFRNQMVQATEVTRQTLVAVTREALRANTLTIEQKE